MVESIADLHELEKLSTTEHRPTTSKNQSQKWQLLLEPALIGSMIAINLGQTSLQNFYLRTACTVDLNYSSDICDKRVGEEFRVAEDEIQKVVASINISRSFIGSLLSTAILLFVGPWSDCSGRRKPLIVMPLVGMCVMTTGVLLMLIFPGASTVQVLYLVQIPISLGGNFGLLLAAAFSHIGDVCHASGRDVTRTMGIHRASIQIAHVVGAVSGPLLCRHLGFYGVFPLVLLLQVLSLVYVIFRMKDVNINSQNKVSVWNWKLPFNAVRCLFKRRDAHRRKIILLMLVVTLGDRVLLSAEVLIAYMYYRNKFHWDDILFGSFLAYRNVVSFGGTLLILTFLKRWLKLSDEMVGVLSCMSYILATSGLIAATNTICVFFLPLVGIISQGSQVVQRPLINKQILPTEQGKIYSVMGALESATQTISSPLYSLLYTNTISTMPDAWLLPGIILAILQLTAYLILRRLGVSSRNAEIETVKVNAEIKKLNNDLNVSNKLTNDLHSNNHVNKIELQVCK